MQSQNQIQAALQQAREIDPRACTMGPGAEDCLLVAAEYGDAVVAMFPGSYRDDNDPATAWTRVMLPEVL